MPFNPDWLVPDASGHAPVERWLGQLKAFHVEAAQVVNRIRTGALEDGTQLTPGQRQKLLGWYDTWLNRIRQHLQTSPE